MCFLSLIIVPLACTKVIRCFIKNYVHLFAGIRSDPGPQTQGSSRSSQEYQSLVYQSEKDQSYLLHAEYV